MNNEFWLLIPITVMVGIVASFKKFPKLRYYKKKHSPYNYLTGLNFLLNEEPDKALDAFIKMLEVDSETVETHLALGNLFRRRGEVNRAIRIHQNLIARPNLNKIYKSEALLSLAEDYLSSGVLDRAERLFLELIKIGDHVKTGLKHLLNIYEQEHEWKKAINVSKKLSYHSKEDLRFVIAHYYCELAKIAINKNHLELAQKYLKKALSNDKSCVRASLLLSDILLATNHPKKAISYLKYIKNQNHDFLSESILPLVKAFQSLNKEKSLIIYLKNILKEFPEIPIAIILSDQIRQLRGNSKTIHLIANHVIKHPSIQGLNKLLEIQLLNTDPNSKEFLSFLYDITKKMIDESPLYRCTHCGFSSKILHWQCPTCKKWNTIKLAILLTKN